MIKNYVPVLTFFFSCLFSVSSQDLKIFRVSDYDLKGNVKSCLVITDYGRELFEFDEAGRLLKTITQYNEADQDITLYSYADDMLLEKRLESYKNNQLDESTSMANFYTLDTVPRRKIVEKIVSYDKDFLELQEYQYNDSDQLVKIITSSEDGVDETTYEYTPYKGEMTTSIFNNGILEKSIRTSEKKTKNGTRKVILTKEFIDGQPNSAQEEITDESGKVLSREDFLYDLGEKKFVSQQKLTYHYADNILEKVTTETEKTKAVEEYIFQFDNSPYKNWVKQIRTPSNAYTTRIIEYYPEDKLAEDSNR